MDSEKPAEAGLPTSQPPSRTDESYIRGGTDGQWAKVPEWIAYKDLDSTALNVLIIMAAKAGRDRVAWISHRTIGEGLGVHRTTVGRAVRNLEKVGVLEEAGKVVVDRERGTWVKRYRIVDRCPDLPEVHLERTSGESSNQPSDQPEVHPGRTSVGEIFAPPEGPEVHMDGPEVHIGTPEVHPGRTHSVPLYQSLRYQSLLDAQFGIEEDPKPNGQTKGAPKEELKEFWFKGKWHPYKSKRSA